MNNVIEVVLSITAVFLWVGVVIRIGPFFFHIAKSMYGMVGEDLKRWK